MTKYQLYALTNAVDGQEEAFNRWYTQTHVRDVKRFPGVLSAKRLELVSTQGTVCKYKYLAAYEVETDLDPNDFTTQLLAQAGTDKMFMSPALDFSDFQLLLFKPIT